MAGSFSVPMTPARAAAIKKLDAWTRANFPTAWAALKKQNPNVFDPARVALVANVGAGLGQTEPETSWGESILQFVQGLLPTVASYQIFKTNLKRAEQGLPPVDAGTVAPVVKVQATTDDATRNMLAIGGIGLLAVLAFGAYRKGR